MLTGKFFSVSLEFLYDAPTSPQYCGEGPVVACILPKNSMLICKTNFRVNFVFSHNAPKSPLYCGKGINLLTLILSELHFKRKIPCLLVKFFTV